VQNEKLTNRVKLMEVAVQCRDEQIKRLTQVNQYLTTGSVLARESDNGQTSLTIQPPPRAMPADLPGLSRMKTDEMLERYQKVATHMSNLMIAVERPHPDIDAQRTLFNHLDQVLQSGTNVRVLNPCICRLPSRPAGRTAKPLPDDQHWQKVVMTLQLTQEQESYAASLYDLYEHWMQRINEDHAKISQTLAHLMQQKNCLTMRFCSNDWELRRGMLLEATRKLTLQQWSLMTLLEEMWIGHILVPIQQCRYIVHSYPYGPDPIACMRVLTHATPKRSATFNTNSFGQTPSGS